MIKLVVEGGFGVCEFEEGGAGGSEGVEVERVREGERLPGLHQLLHVPPPRFAARDGFLSLQS